MACGKIAAEVLNQKPGESQNNAELEFCRHLRFTGPSGKMAARVGETGLPFQSHLHFVSTLTQQG